MFLMCIDSPAAGFGWGAAIACLVVSVVGFAILFRMMLKN